MIPQTRNIRSSWSGDMGIKMSLFIVKWVGSYWYATVDNGKHKHNDMYEDSYVNI